MWLTAPDDDGTACVPITKQPASDNPFLKNHKIQVHEYIVYLDFIWAFYLCSKCWCLVYFTCSFIFRWSLTIIQRDSLMTTKCLLQSQEKKDIHIPQLWHQYGGKCFEGTIPMRRTKEDDFLRASSFKRYGKKKEWTLPFPKSAEPDLINQRGHQMSKVFFFLVSWSHLYFLFRFLEL